MDSQTQTATNSAWLQKPLKAEKVTVLAKVLISERVTQICKLELSIPKIFQTNHRYIKSDGLILSTTILCQQK